MPMFAAWGAYAVEVMGNSERLSGFGLYGHDLELTHTAHHPVLVWFHLIQGGQPPPSREYSLKAGLTRWLGQSWVDLRDRVKSWSDWSVVKERPRSFGDIETIALHHLGTVPQTDDEEKLIEIVTRYHRGKGWGTIGYHFCIGKETVYFTAPVKVLRMINTTRRCQRPVAGDTPSGVLDVLGSDFFTATRRPSST